MASRFEIDRSQYFPDVARSVTFPTIREARAEYSRLRKIAAKRLQRLAGAGYGSSSTYQRYVNAFSPLPRDLSESRVYKKLNEVAYFLSLKSSSVTGEREKISSTVETLQELGYDFINEGNINTFAAYMDSIRRYVGGHSSDYSSQAIDIFRDALDAGEAVDPEQMAKSFADWLLGEEEEAPVFEEQEPIPGEREPDRRSGTRRKKTPAQKRAERNKQRADQSRREKQRRKNRRRK